MFFLFFGSTFFFTSMVPQRLFLFKSLSTLANTLSQERFQTPRLIDPLILTLMHSTKIQKISCLQFRIPKNHATFVGILIYLNLFKIDTHKQSNEFFNIMSSHSFRPLIEVPTRITSTTSTLIDNIFTNSLSSRNCSGLFVTDMSDHLPIFVIFDWNPTPTKNVNFVSYSSKNHLAYNIFRVLLIMNHGVRFQQLQILTSCLTLLVTKFMGYIIIVAFLLSLERLKYTKPKSNPGYHPH